MYLAAKDGQPYGILLVFRDTSILPKILLTDYI